MNDKNVICEKIENINLIKDSLCEKFLNIFDDDLVNSSSYSNQKLYNQEHNPLRVFFAPGRVNLIGEHLDYNGGAVFPCGLNLGIYVVIRKRPDTRCRFYSGNFQKSGVFSCFLNKAVLRKLEKYSSHSWCNYVIGTVFECLNRSYSITNGFDLYVYGTIPNGAGLSSSASFVVCIIFALNCMFDLNMNDLDIIKFARYVENNFIGVNCGIMDQFAVVKATTNNAIYLNCETLAYEYAPLDLGQYSLVIANTNKKRKLSESNYNQRFSECQQALGMLAQHKEIDNLSQLTLESWDSLIHIFDGFPDLYKRVNHVITENARTYSSLSFLKSGNLIKFGELMYQSHLSLRDDYDVTGVELDTIVDLAINLPYCIGARMTGAGGGGCSVNLVQTSHIRDFIDTVTSKYTSIIGTAPSMYIAKVSDGVREL